MSGAHVVFRLPDGTQVVCGAGAIVGRSFAADVRLDDGRVSEAHALVSLRGRELVLLPLRGRLRVVGRDVARVVLAAGVDVELASGVVVGVVAVGLPRAVLAASLSGAGPAAPPQVLTGVTSVMAEPTPHLEAGVQKHARALIFSDGLSWFVRVGDGAARDVVAGDRVDVDVDGVVAAFVDVDIDTLAAVETAPLLTETRLRVVSRFDSVEVFVGDERAAHLSGVPARIVAELLAFGGPVRWEMLAEALWSEPDVDKAVLRHRLDVALTRLRKRLAHAGVRRDFITAHRTGQIELVLAPGDRTEDLA